MSETIDIESYTQNLRRLLIQEYEDNLTNKEELSVKDKSVLLRALSDMVKTEIDYKKVSIADKDSNSMKSMTDLVANTLRSINNSDLTGAHSTAPTINHRLDNLVEGIDSQDSEVDTSNFDL